jgi:hypothetical protein
MRDHLSLTGFWIEDSRDLHARTNVRYTVLTPVKMGIASIPFL